MTEAGIPDKPNFERSGDDAVAELEAFIAEAEARGETVPAEAHMMLARLRELMAALRGLTSSLEERGEPPKRSTEEPDRG
jgi:hypothetical protein